MKEGDRNFALIGLSNTDSLLIHRGSYQPKASVSVDPGNPQLPYLNTWEKDSTIDHVTHYTFGVVDTKYQFRSNMIVNLELEKIKGYQFHIKYE